MLTHNLYLHHLSHIVFSKSIDYKSVPKAREYMCFMTREHTREPKATGTLMKLHPWGGKSGKHLNWTNMDSMLVTSSVMCYTMDEKKCFQRWRHVDHSIAIPSPQPRSKELSSQPSKSMFSIPKSLSINLGRGARHCTFPGYHWLTPILLTYRQWHLLAFKRVLVWKVIWSPQIYVFFHYKGKGMEKPKPAKQCLL